MIAPLMGLTGPSGSYSFSVSSISAGVSVFTATDITDTMNFMEIAQVIFTSGVGASFQSTVVASPTSLAADGTSTSTITVTLRDSQGNLVPGKTVTLSSNRGATDTLSSASGPSDSSGVVTFNVKSATSGSSTFIAVDTTDSVSVNQAATITFLANLVSASQSTVAASPSSLPADGSTPSTVTVTLKDSAGNPVSGRSVSLSSSRGALDTISSASGASNSLGSVTFYVKSLNAGSSIYTAIDSTDTITITQAPSVTFSAGPVSSAQSTVAASPTSVTANGSTPSIVTITLLDASSNPVSGKTVTLTSSRGGSDTISSASGSSNSLGRVTFTVLSSSVGSSSFTATDTTDSLTVAQTISVNFVVGSTSVSASTVVASPTLVSGDGLTPSTVTVTLLDSYSHPVSGKTVSLSSSRGGSDTISTANSTSDSNGQTVFTILSSTVGDAVLTAQNTTESVILTQTVNVHFYGNLSSSSKIIATPASLPADNSSLSTIKVTLLDSTSTPIPGKTITLSSSRGALDTITTLSGTTSAGGQATFTLKSSKVGMPILTATDSSDGITINQSFRLNLLGPGASPQTDYRADLAQLGYLPGNNSLPVSIFQNVEALGNNGNLYSFGYTTSSGWSGDGSLLTSGTLGPNRLVFNGTSSYLDLGSSVNSNSSFSFETWVRPLNSATSGSVILSNADSSNKGFTLSQLSDGSGKVSLAPAGVASVYSQAVLADSPLIYWKLDEASGTQALDLSGNGNTGSYYPGSSVITYGQPSLVTGQGSSVHFPGTGDSTLYSNASFTNPQTFTLELWFQTSGTATGKLIGFGDHQSGGSSSNDRDITMNSSGTLGVRSFNTSNAYNDGKVHHLVGVYSPTTISLFVDSVSVGTNSSSGVESNYTGYWRVGGDSYGLISGPAYFNGTLDEVAIYPSALSATQIQAHYLAGTENCISQTSLSSNVWNHLAGVFSGSGNTASLYLNGNQQCSITLAGIPYSGSANDLTVGSSSLGTNFWSGAVANIKTYAQALTGSLVQQNYAVTAAQFDVQQLGVPAPIMWLRADSIQGLSDGALVSTWLDSSANGNSIVNGVSKPVWKEKLLNGYPVVRFFTGDMYAPSVFPANSDYTILVALTYSQSFGDETIIGYGDTGPGHIFGLNGNTFFVSNDGNNYYNASSGIAVGASAILSITYQYGSGAGNFFINGLASGSSNIEANTNGSMRLGYSYGHYSFRGDIAEVFLFGSALSNNDRALVETYLNAKYGIF